MKKVSEFIGSMARLSGTQNASRVDRANLLVFHDEIKGDTVFDKKPGESGRLDVLFRGWPDHGKALHVKRLARFLELQHYIQAHKVTEEEVLEAEDLETTLVVSEAEYPEVAEVMSVADAKKSGSFWT